MSVNSGSLGYACRSSSKLCFTENKVDIENDQLDIERVFIKIEESFYNDTENKKVADPVVTFEVKEDQEFDMQMSQNMRQNPTNRKLDIRQTHQSSLWLVRSGKMKHIIQIKSHGTPAVVTNTDQKGKPTQDWFQKPLHADNCSASDNKSMEPESENGNSSPPDSPSASEVHANEELEEGMQRFKNEIGMFRVELLALEKEKV